MSYLKSLQFGLRDGVGFCNNRNNIDFGVEFLHADQIQRFESVSSWTDEVQANVYTTVMARGQWSFNFQLLLQIGLELGINVIDNRFERIIFVDLIAVADRIAYRQLESNATLLQLIRVRFQFHIRQCMGTRCRLEARIEQCVHQCRLTQTRLTCIIQNTLDVMDLSVQNSLAINGTARPCEMR